MEGTNYVYTFGVVVTRCYFYGEKKNNNARSLKDVEMESARIFNAIDIKTKEK